MREGTVAALGRYVTAAGDLSGLVRGTRAGVGARSSAQVEVDARQAPRGSCRRIWCCPWLPGP